ncbi:MAG: aminotransferase class V-fold PLP-dependent enzyme [Oscillospiraceae bacterium]|jgi:cysteine desulfurase family protein|nr:aminotransferase class V-fold PLP-dependent enzyme [Oscillospiraceae bacterium]
MIYFDNAATTFPKPAAVQAASAEAFTRYGANPGRSGHPMSIDTATRVYEAREKAAAFLGAEQPEDAAFTLNCTHAVNIALKGLLCQGDHVILSDLEHNAVLRPLHALYERGIISYSIAETFSDPGATVRSFSRLIRPETRLIAATHASNVFGLRLPIKELGELCRQRDILFLVDAAQTAGVVPIDARATGIDFLCAAGHKGLYGPSGTGLLITPLGSLLETITEGGTGSHSAEYSQPRDMPDRLESGTVNTMGILGLGAGIEWVSKITPQKIYAHEMKVATHVFERLKRIKGVILYTPDFGPGSHMPVVAFNLEGKSSEEVTSRLGDMGFALRGGLHCAPLAHQKMGTLSQGAARISVGVFNTEQEADSLCDAVKKLAG